MLSLPYVSTVPSAPTTCWSSSGFGDSSKQNGRFSPEYYFEHERRFGLLNGAVDFYTGRDYGSRVNYMRLDSAVYEAPADFYATDQFTDFAIEEVARANQEGAPFFLYLAYNAPHFPLQAPAENVQKYQGQYDIGWDSLRRIRYQRMQQLGVIDDGWSLSPRDTLTPAWETLSSNQQQAEVALMEVYTRMIDQLDEQIG